MSGCCGHDAKFDGVSDDYKRRLWIVIALNAVMFVIEMTAGHLAKSQALQADALDFAGDALTYGISLAVIGSSISIRTNAALFKGVSLLLMGLWVLGSTVYRVFYIGIPTAEIMGVVGFFALLTNLASVLLLVRYKDGDANVRSVWLCSRNDAIGNVAVMFAALGVWGTATGWPDLIVAAIMAGLFLSSAFQIVKQALAEKRETTNHKPQTPRGRMMQIQLAVLGLCIAGATLAAFVWSIAYPERRIWPPRRYTWVTPILVWVPTFTLSGVLFLLGVWGWGTVGLPDFIRFGLGIPLILLGNIVVWSEVSHFGVPQTGGAKGTLRTAGMYRYSRNPQYMADIAIVAGWMVLSAAPWTIVVGLASIIVLIAAPFAEEPWLKEQYGEAFVAYCEKVRRFI